MTFDTCGMCMGAKQKDGKVCAECYGFGATMTSCFIPPGGAGFDVADGTPARPFLKWQGGKAKLTEQLLARAPKEFGTYFEPFLGGGALFFALRPELAFLSDLNDHLVTTFRAVRDDPEKVISQLDHMLEMHAADPEKTYYEYRNFNLDSVGDMIHDAGIAAWFIYLNKTGFNGLYRVNRKGEFNVPIGTNGRKTDPKVYDREELLAASAALQGAMLDSHGYDKACSFVNQGDFVYLDPPYAPLSATANFTGYTAAGFGPADQVAVRDTALAMKRRGVHVLLSNSSAPLIRDLYKGPDWEVQDVEVQRTGGTAKGRGVVKELIIS
jgi:DNA adenine methylase